MSLWIFQLSHCLRIILCSDTSVGIGASLPISSVGRASFSTSSRSFCLYDVLHVSGLSASLVSIQRYATNNPVFLEFHPSFFVVKDLATKEVPLKGTNSRGLYSLHVSCSSPTTFLSARVSLFVWHN